MQFEKDDNKGQQFQLVEAADLVPERDDSSLP